MEQGPFSGRNDGKMKIVEKEMNWWTTFVLLYPPNKVISGYLILFLLIAKAKWMDELIVTGFTRLSAISSRLSALYLFIYLFIFWGP